MSQIDPSEPALTEPTDDPIAPDFGGIAVRRSRSNSRVGGCEPAVPDRLFVSSEEPFEASAGDLRGFRFRQVLRLIHRSIPDNDRSL